MMLIVDVDAATLIQDVDKDAAAITLLLPAQDADAMLMPVPLTRFHAADVLPFRRCHCYAMPIISADARRAVC